MDGWIKVISSSEVPLLYVLDLDCPVFALLSGRGLVSSWQLSIAEISPVEGTKEQKLVQP